MSAPKETKERVFKFDAFKFIENRQYGISPTKEDFANFGNFMCCACVSMNRDYLSLVPHFNSMGFSKLTKEQQCLAYTSLDGKPFPRKQWLKGTKAEKAASKEDIRKICRLMDCSVREATSLMTDPWFDVEKAMRLYAERYEPSTLVNIKGRGFKAV